MESVVIYSAEGTPPFQISLCDMTNTFCYIVGIDVTSFPVTLTVPPPLQNVNQMLVSIKDAYYCNTFQTLSFLTPTPTPTPTPTATPIISDCRCIVLDNSMNTLDYDFSLNLCNGSLLEGVIYSGTTLYYCGNSPSVEPEVGVTIGDSCSSGTCPTPTPTL